jgi:hypothetical protein
MTPEEAYRLARNHPSEFEKNKDEYENIIATDGYYPYYYARDVLKGRFEKGEDAIATNEWYSYYYAEDILNGRFEKGEYAISEDSYYFIDYHDLIKSKPNTISFYYKFI